MIIFVLKILDRFLILITSHPSIDQLLNTELIVAAAGSWQNQFVITSLPHPDSNLYDLFAI